MYVLKKIIEPKMICMSSLIENENALDYINENYDIEDILFFPGMALNRAYYFSKNPSFIPILNKNFHWINIKGLCQNRSGLHLVRKYFFNSITDEDMILLAANESAMYLIDELLQKRFKLWIYPENFNLYEDGTYSIINKFWKLINQNRSCMNLLRKYPHNVILNELFINPSAIHIIEKIYEREPNKINWDHLSFNDAAIHLLEQNIDNINYYSLAYNKNIDKLIEKYPNIKNKIENYLIFGNENPQIISLIEKKKIRIKKNEWRELINNPYSIYLFEKNPDKLKKIEGYNISKNTGIFEIDFKYIEERCNIFKKELLGKFFHPYKIIE